MYTKRENFIRTMEWNQPDRLVNDYEALSVIRQDPVTLLDRGLRIKGQETKDIFGTVIIWPEDQPGGMPHVTEENKVIKDITNWKNELKLPNFKTMDLDWEPALLAAKEINREEQLLTSIMGTGLFERLHFLMGFEDTLINFLEEPEAMHELIEALLKVRLDYVELLMKNLKPEVIIHHDDFGSKHSLFLHANTWRSFFLEPYTKLYGFMREQGVIVIHHADCYGEPIASDLAVAGAQGWQGAIPENNITSLQENLKNKLVIMGGIDAGIDSANWKEEEIRKETRRACETYGPAGGFIPCMTYGAPGTIFPEVLPILKDEINCYNQEYYHFS